jgi:hypothetical protein
MQSFRVRLWRAPGWYRRALPAMWLVFPCIACEGQDCTDMGCATEAVLRFRPAVEAPGQYTVRVLADGKPYECATSLPPWASSAGEECSSTEMWLILEGLESLTSSALVEGPARNLAGVGLEGRFQHVEFTLLQDETVLTTRDLELEYVETEPNGPGCGTCAKAEHWVTIPD